MSALWTRQQPSEAGRSNRPGFGSSGWPFGGIWRGGGTTESLTASAYVVYSAIKTWVMHLAHVSPPEPLLGIAVVKWDSPSVSDPRAKNTGQRATKGTVPTSPSWSPWCDCRRLGSTLASGRWQDINVGNPLWRWALLTWNKQRGDEHWLIHCLDGKDSSQPL